jgi:hypothetical protein
MPTLVHLADERNKAKIKQNGIRIGKYQSGIYCLPVMQNFYVSHQWLRELKRFGGNTFVGVYFKADSNEKVFAGKYHEQHRHIILGEAISEILTLEDPLGYELVIDRKIQAKEIQDIRHLPQSIGWRYQPGANGSKPCGCDYCQKGRIKAKSVRHKYGEKNELLTYNEIIERLKMTTDEWEIASLLSALGQKRRYADPLSFAYLLNEDSDAINQQLALILTKFRHKNTKAMLLRLLEAVDDETREYAADSMLKLYGKEVEGAFILSSDKAIQTAVINWQAEIK